MGRPFPLLLRRLAFSLVVLAGMSCGPTLARTLDLAFMPPETEPQDLCKAGQTGSQDDLSAVVGEDGLTDELRLRFVQRDIRNLTASDPDRWFDFILTLIDWRAKLNPEFGGTEALLARIALYVDAGRLEELQDAGLIDQLRQTGAASANSQKMALAQYYLNGIGVAQDIDYARSLIRDAAYGGNVEALMSIARMDLQGNPVPGWDAPLDLTVTLAFGGMLGQMNASVCDRAARIAQEYQNGEVVSRNPEIAYAWNKFSADLGGAEAAWRIVEFHLNADAARKDNAEMLRYLQLAVQRGIAIDPNQTARIKDAGNVDDGTLRQILGFNYSADSGGERKSVASYLQLAVNLDAIEVSQSSPYLDYLRELTKFDTAPGWVFTKLAKEVLGRRGEWAGEAEAMPLLEEAARRGDPDGMQLLAKRLVRWRDDPAKIDRAADLLAETVTRFGLASAMQDLDTLYRCQANDAPRLDEADLWARNYRATQDEVVTISPGDLISLDPYKKPETLMRLQTQALDDHPQSLANFIERLQLDPWARDRSLRLWAARASQSVKALEVFAELEFALARNPAERDLAVELFRRIFLNNGVTTSLDLAVALTEDNGRNPEIATEIIAELTKAGNRGEGAAIRMKARLLAKTQTAQSVYAEFEKAIDERGDFLALMFAMPFVSSDKVEDYIDRAVSLMTCGTKDADELGDAYALLLSPEMTYHWRQVGLAVEGGHVLAKLGLTDAQFAEYRVGAAPSATDVYARALAEGDKAAERSLYALTADPGLPTHDMAAAADHLLALLKSGNAEDAAWALTQYRKADPALRGMIAARIDVISLFRRAAEQGEAAEKLDYALLLRSTARGPADLQASAQWLKSAAEGGDVAAMAELGEAMAFGIGVPADRTAALVWLDQAARADVPRAAELARILRLQVVQ